MARIEISLDEYNGLRQKVNTLEQTIAVKNKKIEELEELTYESQAALKMLINDTTWVERTLQWKKLVDAINPKLYTE